MYVLSITSLLQVLHRLCVVLAKPVNEVLGLLRIALRFDMH